MYYLVWNISTPLNRSKMPRFFMSIDMLELMLAIISVHVSCVLAATTKSSTWRRNNTISLLTVPLHKQGSCQVGLNPMFFRILLMCFSHSHGDSWCPWMALCTWMMLHSFRIGGLPRWFSHQSRYASSMYICSGWLGPFSKCIGHVSSYGNKISFATSAQNRRSLGASREFA